jgi:hypothetical protein
MTLILASRAFWEHVDPGDAAVKIFDNNELQEGSVRNLA